MGERKTLPSSGLSPDKSQQLVRLHDKNFKRGGASTQCHIKTHYVNLRSGAGGSGQHKPVHQGSRASVWNWSNPRHEALQGEPMSRSESELDSASLRVGSGQSVGLR